MANEILDNRGRGEATWHWPRIHPEAHKFAGIAAMASAAVFGGYYLLLIGGETLADQSIVPPALAMWSANIVVLGLAAMTLRATPRGMDAAQLPAMPRR